MTDTIFRRAWCRETAHPSCRAAWTHENPALGQCACTALIVQEFLGGTISRLEFPDGMVIYHNRVLNQVVDLTWQQHTKEKMYYYEQCQPSIEPRTREQLLANPDTNYRYHVLRTRVLKELGAMNGQENTSGPHSGDESAVEAKQAPRICEGSPGVGRVPHGSSVHTSGRLDDSGTGAAASDAKEAVGEGVGPLVTIRLTPVWYAILLQSLYQAGYVHTPGLARQNLDMLTDMIYEQGGTKRRYGVAGTKPAPPKKRTVWDILSGY